MSNPACTGGVYPSMHWGCVYPSMHWVWGVYPVGSLPGECHACWDTHTHPADIPPVNRMTGRRLGVTLPGGRSKKTIPTIPPPRPPRHNTPQDRHSSREIRRWVLVQPTVQISSFNVHAMTGVRQCQILHKIITQLFSMFLN